VHVGLRVRLVQINIALRILFDCPKSSLWVAGNETRIPGFEAAAFSRYVGESAEVFFTACSLARHDSASVCPSSATSESINLTAVIPTSAAVVRAQDTPPEALQACCPVRLSQMMTSNLRRCRIEANNVNWTKCECFSGVRSLYTAMWVVFQRDTATVAQTRGCRFGTESAGSKKLPIAT
jgi:hypothetical protein